MVMKRAMGIRKLVKREDKPARAVMRQLAMKKQELVSVVR